MKILTTVLALTLLAIPAALQASSCNHPSPTFVYYKAGGGSTSVGGYGDGAASAGIGVRHRENRLGWDLSLYSLHGPDRRLSDILAGVRGLGLFYLTPKKLGSFYLGAGLGLASRWAIHDYWGDYETKLRGLWGEFAVGYEWVVCIPRRACVTSNGVCRFQRVGYPMRLFLEFSGHQPLAVSEYGRERLYRFPALTLELGVGF